MRSRPLRVAARRHEVREARREAGGPLGAPDNPLDEAERLAKFHDCARHASAERQNHGACRQSNHHHKAGNPGTQAWASGPCRWEDARQRSRKPTVAPKRAATVAPVSTGREAGRAAAAAVAAKAPAKATKLAAAPKRAPVATAPAVKLSKDELRVQVEKLERANATLRLKNREANRMAKTATARITELEENVARLIKKAASQAPSADGEQAAKPSHAKRQSRGVDHDHATPAGAADRKPAPLNEAGEAVLEEQPGHS